MFGADQIYNTGINFIHDYIDSEFTVSDHQIKKTFLVISPIIKKPHHFSDLSSLEFDDDENAPPVVEDQEKLDPNTEISKGSEKVPTSNIEHSAIYKIKTSVPQLMKKPLMKWSSCL